MKYLITGGCGFLGSNIAGQILKKGEELLIFDNLYRSGSEQNLNWLRSQGQYQFIHADIRNTNDVERAVKEFKPDVIFIDYLNICASSRYKSNSGVNSYTYIESISEELRALAVEYGVPVVTSTQVTRGASTSSDPDMADVSESFGVAANVDNIVALIKTEELDNMGQVMFKQIKNRDNDVSKYKRFVVGVDRNKMRLYDVEQDAQVEALDEALDESYNYEETTNKKDKFSKFKY